MADDDADDPARAPFAARLRELYADFGHILPLYTLDDAGQPVPCNDPMAWAEWMATHPEQRQVAQDRNEGRAPGEPDIRVSTIFAGNVLGYSLPGTPPVLFETMVFGGPLDRLQRRYHTRDDALAGHQEVCQLVMTAPAKDDPR